MSPRFRCLQQFQVPMLQVLGMVKQLFLHFVADIVLDDNVVGILLFPCKLSFFSPGF